MLYLGEYNKKMENGWGKKSNMEVESKGYNVRCYNLQEKNKDSKKEMLNMTENFSEPKNQEF